MTSEELTKEQLAFLEECNLEFSERFTDFDLEYKKVYDEGIPPPPIVSPWYNKGRFANRYRAGGSRHYDNYRDGNRDYHQENYRDREHRYRGQNYYRPY